MKRALVTGAAGFVGRALCSLLQAQGVEVVAAARHEAAGPWQRFVVLDLESQEQPAPGLLAGVDTVFHLAGLVHTVTESFADHERYHLINVEGTRALLELAEWAGVESFLYASSIKAMGEGGPHCFTESYPPRPVTPYGRSKLESEELVAGSQIPHIASLRLSMVYGPGGKGNLERMIAATRRGWFPPLPRCDNHRSMVHVEDVAQAFWLAATTERRKRRSYLVTDGVGYATEQIQDLIRQALGLKPFTLRPPLTPFTLLANAGDKIGQWAGRRMPFDSAALNKLTSSAWYSSEMIEQELGFKPKWTLAKALPAMVATGAAG